MNNFSRVLLSTLILTMTATASLAEDELIGTTSIFFGTPLEANYLNITHPDPSVKVMSFTGTASNFGTTTLHLGIHFDYIDMNGIHQIIPLPNFYVNALAPGVQDVPINAGPVQLPYCPEEVSIHFELLDPGEAEFQGIFNHTCVPVPEPSTLAMAALGATALGLAGWRRRPRRHS